MGQKLLWIKRAPHDSLSSESTTMEPHMMTLQRKQMKFLFATVWLIVGVALFFNGMRLILHFLGDVPFEAPLLGVLDRFFGGKEYGAIALIALSLFVGRMKGRTILTRAAKKGIARLDQISEPIRVTELYAPRFFLLIALMMGLGLTLRFLGTPEDIRGAVNLAVGAALIQGALFAFSLRSTTV
jgi:hypothetical protein